MPTRLSVHSVVAMKKKKEKEKMKMKEKEKKMKMMMMMKKMMMMKTKMSSCRAVSSTPLKTLNGPYTRGLNEYVHTISERRT